MTRQIYKISLQLANFLHTISRIAGKVHFSFALFQRKNKYPTLPEAAIPSCHHRGDYGILCGLSQVDICVLIACAPLRELIRTFALRAVLFTFMAAKD